MSFKGVNAALMFAYSELGLGLPTAYEGVSFEPASGADWAAVFVLPAINEPITLGIGGEDEEEGILQIDFNVPEGDTTAGLLGYADTVQSVMVAGQSFTQNTTSVYIRNVDRTNIRAVDGWLRITLNIIWYSRYTRATI